MAEIFPNLKKKIDTQFQKAQKLPKKMKPKRHTPTFITMKMWKVKDKEILKRPKGKKNPSYVQNNPIKVRADFSAETVEARKEWHNIFKVPKEKAFN